MRALRAAQAEAQPRDHLVEDNQRAVTPRAFEQALDETGLRQHQPHVGADRFDGDRRKRRLASGEFCIDVGEIVVARDDRLGADAGRDSAAGCVVRLRRRAGVV